MLVCPFSFIALAFTSRYSFEKRRGGGGVAISMILLAPKFGSLEARQVFGRGPLPEANQACKSV